MRVVVDHTRCEGHAMCAAIAPATFVTGTDSLAQPVDAEFDDADSTEIQLAVDSCPVAALHIENR